MNTEPIFSDKVTYFALAALGLLAFIAFLLYDTVSTDLMCVRSLGSIECSIVHNTRILKMSPIKISEPLAVDVMTQRNRKSPDLYIAQIRTADFKYALPLITTYSYKIAQDAADEVNHFLLASKDFSLSTRFPKKMKHSSN